MLSHAELDGKEVDVSLTLLEGEMNDDWLVYSIDVADGLNQFWLIWTYLIIIRIGKVDGSKDDNDKKSIERLEEVAST